MARAAGPADRHFRDCRRPAHERLGLCLLRAVTRRRHHPLGRPDQDGRQRAREGADLSADVKLLAVPAEYLSVVAAFAGTTVERSLRLHVLQRSVEILDYVIRMFESRGEADEAFADAEFGARLRREPLMRGRGGVRDQAL